MFKALCCLLVSWVIMLSCFSQGLPTMVSTSDAEKQKEFVLDSLDINVTIHGPLAETSMTMVFKNPHGRALEGELNFPLPEGATVSSYALDIDGKMVDGVIVEKEKARKVFEEIVRQGTDPGLVEKTRGNSFKTRVFPMPPKGERKIRVDYVSELARTRNSAVYHLPMTYNSPIPSFSMRMEVYYPSDKPVVSDGELSNFEFEEWRSGFFAETATKDLTLTKDLRVAVPMDDGQSVFVERTPEGEVYFLLQDLQAVPDPDRRSAEPKSITLLWDTSLSYAGDHTREFNLLRRYFMDLKASVTVKLVEFNITASTVGEFRVGPDGCEPLIKAIEGLAYDGGTSLSSLVSVIAGGGSPDYYLLFTDGLNTFNHDLSNRFRQPVFVMCNANTADHTRLKRLALESGGGYYNLKTHDDLAVIPQLGKPVYRFLSSQSTLGGDSVVYPSIPVPVSNGFVMTGRLIDNSTQVQVKYGVSEADSTHRLFTVNREHAVKGTLFRRHWAQSKINQIQVLGGKDVKKQVTEIGQEFGIVTEGTSLLVLERLDQYVQYDIAPPKSLPKMRADFLAMKQKQADEAKASAAEIRKQQIEAAVSIWKDKLDWWNKTYKYRKIPKKVPKPASADGEEVLEEVEVEEVEEVMESVVAYGGRVSAGRRTAVGRYGGSSASASRTGSAEDAPEPPPEPTLVLEPEKPEAHLKMTIAEVESKEAYMKQLEALHPKAIYAGYLNLKDAYANASAFYLDCSDLLFRKGQTQEGIRVLSSTCELALDKPALLRIVARKLEEVGELDLAITTYEQVKELRSDEPQSWRDLALALELRALRDKQPAGADAERAIDHLYTIIVRSWDRFVEVKPIVLVELNRLVDRATKAGLKSHPVDPRLINTMTPDIRVVLNWDEDNTDMDLWVREPTKEKCFYGFNRTRIGGRISHDFTQGYGPEEYMIRKAIPGKYQVQVNYYGSNSAKLTGAVTLKIDVYQNYGTPNEKKQTVIRRLSGPKDVIDICDFTLEGDPVDVVQEEVTEAKKPGSVRTDAW